MTPFYSYGEARVVSDGTETDVYNRPLEATTLGDHGQAVPHLTFDDMPLAYVGLIIGE